MSQENVDLVTGGYDDFNRGNIEGGNRPVWPGDRVDGAGGGNAPGGTFRGPDSVGDEVFASVPENFDEFSCPVEEVDDQGDTVVTTVQFKGKNKSGAELDTPAEHVWEIRDGKVVRFQNKVDREAWAKGLELTRYGVAPAAES